MRISLNIVRQDIMKYTAIKGHLKPYSIYSRRKTTINHAFASSIAPCDVYDEAGVRAAVEALGQDADDDLLCVYCGATAETWDHVFATVVDSEFSGAGHRLGNLLPCCKPCNSKKGNKPWEIYLDAVPMSEEDRGRRREIIQRYLATYFTREHRPAQTAEYAQLLELRDRVIDIMRDADALAERIRDKSRTGEQSPPAYPEGHADAPSGSAEA